MLKPATLSDMETRPVTRLVDDGLWLLISFTMQMQQFWATCTIVKFFSMPGSPIVLVSRHSDKITRGSPSLWTLSTRGV